MIKLDQISLPIGFCDKDIIKICAKTLKIQEKSIKNFKIIKLAIDARRKPNIKYIANIALNLENNLEGKFKHLSYFHDDSLFTYNKKSLSLSPIVVGFGPSGMFSALALARMGLKPIVIEQGKQVEEREKDINEFWEKGKLNPFSNVQFGEGGAGTFSDGKLNTNLNNLYCKKILNEFVHFGAPQEILYLSKPHIGSDNLKKVVKNIRQGIENLGGKILFSHKMTNILIENDRISSIEIKNLQTNQTTLIKTNHLLLCLGHSARDSFEMLYKNNFNIIQKPFAMGVRIELAQEKVNISQYGKGYDKRLPNADFKLVTHLSNGRSVFTFCMCPGGYVVASSSEEGEIVTNGMSNFARNGENANSALLVNVTPDDYNSSHPLAGIYFQSKYEKLAFELGGKNYNAPAQSVGEFLGIKTNNSINSTYKPDITYTKIEKGLPEFVSQSLKEGIVELNKKLHGFSDNDNLLIAIESRSSCPLTILRDENFESNIKGVYPVGEGAGYAGGIISSAQDGIKTAEKIYNSL